jgi:predicted RNase H-like nuclease
MICNIIACIQWLFPYIRNALIGQIQNIELIIPDDAENNYRIIKIRYLPKYNSKKFLISFYSIIDDITELKTSAATSILKKSLWSMLSEMLIAQ